MSDIRQLVQKMAFEKYYQHVLPILNQVNGSCAVIKGESLSLQAYGTTGRRLSSDIDILVSRTVLSEVEQILHSNGFTNTTQNRSDRILMLSGSHQVSPWVKEYSPWGMINIDLNFDIFWGEYTGKRMNMDDFLSDVVEIELFGIKCRTLPPLKAMIQLILHHYKEMNSIYHLARHDCINYNMFQDVYYLWKNNQTEISLNKLYDMSAEYGIIPYVFYVLYYTNQIFKDSALESYIEAFRTPEGLALLDIYGLSEQERKPWKVDFRTRLETRNLYALIKDDLTEADIEKLERNRRIFG